MNKKIKFLIKTKPLSVNKAWKGKRFKTNAYKAYEQELLYTLPQITLPKPPFKIKFEFGFSNKNSDIDNPAKLLIDIMQKKYNFNDRDIYELYIKKKIVNKRNEYFTFTIDSTNELS